MAKTQHNPVLEPEDVKTTVWHNPLDVETKIDVYEGPGVVRRYRIPAGGSLRLPSYLDQAIRTEHAGNVVGGLAPAWQKLDGENPPVVDAIDAAKTEKKASEDAAVRAYLDAERQKEALLLAQVRAEAAKTKADRQADRQAEGLKKTDK